MESQGQSVYYHYNPRGDVIAMTDKDGQIVASYEYDTWGNVLKSEAQGIAADNPFGYAGYMYDKEMGMYYLIARYYNPDHGVFLSVDPDPGDEDDPVTMNGYTYGDNNPVMKVDPDGHAAIAAGIYLVPGFGQAALIATLAVGGAYGAWYLGKQIKQRFGNKKSSKTSTKYGPKNGTKVIVTKKGDKTIRHFDGTGRVKKDIDYGNHGNPKTHPWPVHRHIWKWKGKTKVERGRPQAVNKGKRPPKKK
ncbi:Wall associated protein [Bacillus wiedmannii]|nr:Wall associated protein [Bacillus wiedmannii]